MNYKKEAFCLCQVLKSYGYDVGLIKRSSIYPYNKGIEFEGTERYFKTWSEVYYILYFMLEIKYSNK